MNTPPTSSVDRGDGRVEDGLTSRELSDRQLDGRACIGCGREDGEMEVFGLGPRGQLFAHGPCIDRVVEEARGALS